MFRFIKKQLRRLARKGNAQSGSRRQPVYRTGESEGAVTWSLEENLETLKTILGRNDDVVFRRFRLGMAEQTGAAVVYIDGMVDMSVLNNNVMKPLMLDSRSADFQPTSKTLEEMLLYSALTVSNLQHAQTIEAVVAGILNGEVTLLVDGLDAAVLIVLKEMPGRAVSEPESEILVRGPREGFTESLQTNLILIRRRLRTPDLVHESLSIGRVTATEVKVLHIQGIASPGMVAEVKRRLRRIDIDGVLESGYLEEFIEDTPHSPFPQIQHTERPDRVAAALLEGRVAILTDGTPAALIVPVDLFSFLTSPEDYYERYFIGTAILFVRFLALVSSLLMPSFYIAITTFHHEMIPPKLLLSVAAARQGVPFPGLVEALIMETVFEILREAGTRLPRSVGSAVSIVGALVIGQAAVAAGIVSPLMVIIVAATGIASFANPSFNLAISLRLLRFPLMLLAGTLGLYGVIIGILLITIHLAGIRSFGHPYLSSLAPLHTGNLKDVLVRAPWWAMDRRPAGISRLDRRRQASGLKPSPARRGDNGRGDK